MLFYFLMLVPLAAMMVSDWKSRTVSIAWLVLLFLLAGTGSVFTNGVETALVYIGINLATLLLTGFALWVYSRLRGKALGEMGGLGDFLFFVALTPLAAPVDFVRGAVIVLVSSLLLWLLLRKHFALDTIPLITFCGIPLAGIVILIFVFGREFV